MPSNLDKFCGPYVQMGLDIAALAWWFLLAALIAAIFAAVTEIIVKLRAPAPDPQLVRTAAIAPIKEIAEALKGLITALATAPVWLALLAAGVLIWWVPGSAVTGACGA